MKTALRQLLLHPAMPELSVLLVMDLNNIRDSTAKYAHEQTFHDLNEVTVGAWHKPIMLLDAAADENGKSDIGNIGARRKQGNFVFYCIIDPVSLTEYLEEYGEGSCITVSFPDNPIALS